ncbi:prepilin peptidase [Clostridium fallax]|uniref:Leader peptidase (Prepilin peptidase) / N-methyltransferase n=1 Tax=Clostridium fallax TaxID=1533 RepID=A0A1M4Z3H7_9CLOT|nr:A24 family peptidase [Clostridium fallax]SHF12508.1 leader peptidase (prepilin peptidase) / N-methyltransferase [Clostridium fallax]SQB22296.1 prepilin signal peptidase PulO-like peptidase [Clostridium fallax]
MIIILLLGLFIGSFLNVCIYRISKDKSIIYPSSYCPFCNEKIKKRDLIPIISYINLKGLCRSCNSKISIKYPIIEGITALVFLFIYIKYGLNLYFLKYSVLGALLILIGTIDYNTQYVYKNTIIISGLISILFIILEKTFYNINILDYIFGGIISGLFIYTIYLLSKGNMGYGDIEIFFIIGLFLGVRLSIILPLITFILTGAIIILFLLLKKVKRNEYIPLGPFIALSTILVILFKDYLLEIYF